MLERFKYEAEKYLLLSEEHVLEVAFFTYHVPRQFYHKMALLTT